MNYIPDVPVRGRAVIWAGRNSMRGFCAKCGRTFGEQMLCPLCGVQLETDTGAAGVPLSVPFVDDTLDGPSSLRRLVFGAITMLGLYQGLKHLVLASAIALTGVGTLSADGQLSLLIAATLTASVVAGTVNRRAEATGLLLAIVGAGAFLAPELVHGGGLPDEWLIGVPTLIALIGVVGGFAGRLVLPPAPSLPTFGRLDSRMVVRIQRKPVRIGWVAIIFGIAVAVAGSAYADALRQSLSSAVAGGGGSFGARPLIAWQISALSALVGGVAAGAQSRAGFRQTAIAGLGAGILTVIALSQHDGNPSAVLEFWMDQLNSKGGGPMPFVALGVSTCIATGLGCWLGNHVFAPVAKK